MADDVVAELDRWLADNATAITITSWAMIKRAHDEIVALRAQLEAVKGIAGNERKLSEAIIQQARDEALEEAARVAQNGCLVPPDGGSPTEEEREMCEHIATAIRALKER